MIFEYLLVGGAVVGMLGTLAVLGAMSDSRSPLMGLMVLLLGGVMLGSSWFVKGEALQIQDVPKAVYEIIAELREGAAR